MSSLNISVDRGDIAKLEKLFAQAEKYSIHQVEGMIKQTMVFAVGSAANATKPRSNQNPEGKYRKLKLGKKHLLRPLVPIPQSMGFWYYREGDFKPFKTEKKLAPSRVKREGLVKVTKAVKAWNRKDGGWKYIPYPGKTRGKGKVFDIHMAGLAKHGWYKSLRSLDKKFSYQTLNHLKKVNGISKVTHMPLFLEVINKVNYISHSSPGAARHGLRMATKRMQGIYQPRIDKKIQREFNKR